MGRQEIGTVSGYNPEIVSKYFEEFGIPRPRFEFSHIPSRRFRLDIAWPSQRIGIEVQGGIWIQGKHGRGSGIRKDMDKRNLQIIGGWRVLEVEPRELCSQKTVDFVKALWNELL
jgi:hypothetical protein